MSFFGRSQSSNAELAGSRLSRQAAAAIDGLLASRGVSRGQLAERLGVPVGAVHQMLSGEADLTVTSLAVVAEQLDALVEIRFVDPPHAASPAADDREDEDGFTPAGHGVVLTRRS